jgi:hypothetical protein
MLIAVKLVKKKGAKAFGSEAGFGAGPHHPHLFTTYVTCQVVVLPSLFSSSDPSFITVTRTILVKK